MDVTCLVSGGKDSILALWYALHQYNVISIITIQSNCSESFLFHLPNCFHVSLIAKMLGISHQTILIDSCDLEEEIQALKNAFKESKAEAVITGGIKSEFQRYKFNYAAELANIKCFNPLWRISSQILLSDLLDSGFEIIFVSLTAMGLNKDLLGKRITRKSLENLQKLKKHTNISLIGEGGEFETFVLDAPFYPARIDILQSKIHWNKYREEGYYEIIQAKLSSKKHQSG